MKTGRRKNKSPEFSLPRREKPRSDIQARVLNHALRRELQNDRTA
jgi:hypothetical protein